MKTSSRENLNKLVTLPSSGSNLFWSTRSLKKEKKTMENTFKNTYNIRKNTQLASLKRGLYAALPHVCSAR